MRKIIIILMFFFSINIYSQSVEEVNNELIENAFSIVLNSDIEFVCESARSATHKESFTVTVLNEKGKGAGHFQVYCDKYRSLNKFSGEVIDRTGKVIRKIKKSDLKMTEYSSGLSTDDYMYYYECSAPYPYTVKYEWEIKRKDGIISFPVFAPQTEFNQSVIQSSYRLTVPSATEARYRLFNSEVTPAITKADNGATIYELSLNNLKPHTSEIYGPSILELVPYAFFNPTDFFFDGTQGNMRTWEEYGHWAYKLLEGRDVLPAGFEQKIKEMTAGCTSDKEKVKVLYDYLANTTRYVSIQLGIGGFQPIAATNVNKTGFGDCKALSNYLKAMLNVIGITSTYTEISMSNPRIHKDYVSLNQTNHVILQVPLEGEILWLECTNATIPFGYIHNDIAGHDAILITEKGGLLTTLPAYPDSLNIQTTVAGITIDPTGKAVVSVRQTSCLSQYEEAYGITKLEPNKQRDLLRKGIQLTQADITNVVITENKEEHPSIVIDYNIETNQYGNKTGNRLFVPVNIFRNSISKLPNKKREHNIHIKYGYLDEDNITIAIPEGYVIESLPKPHVTSGKFGKFEASYEQKDNELIITHKHYFKSGKYSKEEYEQLADFRNAVANQYNSKIILRKE